MLSAYKVWDTAQKEIDDSEDWNSRHKMKVLHYILNAFSVHSKSLCWKLEFTWEKEVLNALSAAVKKANMTAGFISQGISSKYINSIYANIFKSPHPRPKTVLTAHTWKKTNNQNTKVMKSLLQKEQRKKALLITRSRTFLWRATCPNLGSTTSRYKPNRN